MRSNRLAILAHTRPSLRKAMNLAAALPESTLFSPTRYLCEAGPNARAFDGRLSTWLRIHFYDYDGWICFMAIGGLVRLLAPVIKDKRTDPPVIALDVNANFAVCVLSGHRGGGNDLARRVAAILGAQPVITTGSDGLDTLAADLLGSEFGWKIEDETHLTRVSAGIVNGEPVGIFQETGERDWCPADRPLPTNLYPISKIEEATGDGLSACLIISDRLYCLERITVPTIIYRPLSLVVGVGCRRGVSERMIAEAVSTTMEESALAFKSIVCLATVERKRDESGLNDFAAKCGLPVLYYREADLAGVAAPTPSKRVQRLIGVPGVCEQAALLASGSGDLLVPKRRFPMVTVAVARKAGY